MKRIYHPISDWEEVKANMWGDLPDRADALRKAIAFTSDHKLYGYYMMRVIREWKYSCENALTDAHLNQKAWIGHAAVALALNVPEDITREAWGYLTYEQRILANGEAKRAIASWQASHVENRESHKVLGEPLLF